MIAIAFVAFLNGFAIAVVLYRHYVMKPRWETESGLRKELKGLRAELYIAKHGRPVFRPIEFVLHPSRTFFPVKIPYRSHSEVLFIPHPGDLLKGKG